MRSNLRHIIAMIWCLFLCVLFHACKSSKYDVQATTNFQSEIEQQQNLEFTFNKDLCPDSLVNVWDTTSFIDITPAVRGQFRWSSTNVLVFSPAEGFQPGVTYSGKLSGKLLKFINKKLSISPEPVKFHTSDLKINEMHLSWTRGKNVSNILVQMDMTFNYDVNLTEAANRLKLSSKGTAVSISSVNSGIGKTLSLQFLPLTDKDEETPLKVDLQKGIPMGTTKYASLRDTSIAAVIPSRYNLTITGVNGQHTGTEGVLTVTTSQPVLETNLKSMITLVPAVPFEVALSDGGFTITSGNFVASQKYQLNIATGLDGAFGGKMKGEFSEEVTFGKLHPSITFVNAKGMYLSSAGYKNVQLNIVNVPTVEVSVIKVYENNLEQFMRHRKGYDYHYEDNESTDYEYYETDNMGDTIFHKSYDTKKLPRQNAASTLHLDFQDKLKDYNGVYVVTVKSKEQNWVQQSKILAISDIGLIVKEEKDNIYVFANSIKTTEALPQLKVTFTGTNNQKVYSTTTDGEGVAVFKNMSTTSPGFKVAMVTAKKNDDFNFVMFDKTQIGTSRFDVGGRTPNEAGLIAMIYPERNLYRPGETMHISTIVRNEQWEPQAELPVKIKLTLPNGKEFGTARKVLNEQGSCETTFTPPVSAITGTYTVEVYSGNDVLLNAYDMIVEEFMPDRMKVTLKVDKPDYKPGDSVKAIAQADNLFGTPAAGRNYQCELNLSSAVFSPEKFSDFDFTLYNQVQVNADNHTGKTSDKGSASETFKLGDELADRGVVNGNVMVTVFDETGRPMHRYSHFKVYTQPLFIGLKSNDEYVSTKAPVRLDLVALDKNSNPQATTVEIEVIRKEWHSVIQQSGSSYRYESVSEDRVISHQKVQISGPDSKYYFNARESGEYQVRVFASGSDNYISKTLYAYGWDDNQYSSFEVSNEGNVEIKTDKKEYNTGDKVNVLFTTPFEGKLLVTLERDHIINHYYLKTKNKSAALSFSANDKLLPNVYVSATLFRPMDGSELPLTIAHGYQSVTINNKSYELPVKVAIAEKSRSKTRQTINVKTAPGAYVTISAVDEGILQIKNFATPDPYSFFYQKEGLSVNSYDIYPWLMPEIKTRLSSTGGDGGGDGSNRVNPMFVNRVKNVSFWSGIRQADGNGNVRYDIDIPQFSGDLRVMALAYKNKGFGSGDKHMKVADPIVISTALPRFLSPKDEVVMPVSLSNTTNKSTTATITVKTTGPLGVKGSATQTIEIPANREQRAVFYVTADPSIGAGKVSVTVKALNETFTNETDISIRPPASLQKITGSGFAAENKTTTLDTKNNLIPSSVSGKLVIGKSPVTQFSKHIEDLVRYPYGCVEQTTSAAFPQLYYADLVKSMNAGMDKELNPAYNVQQAINKLQSMQQGDGGLSYWPQGGEESWWGSIYACHFLLEAKKAGFEVNSNSLQHLEEYMKFRLYKKEVITFYYNGNSKKQVAPEEVPYSLYVLALAGQTDKADMNYYKAHSDMLTLDGKYLLAAAYSLSGQPTQAQQILPPAFAGEVPDRCLGGSFYSPIRDEAISLNVLLDMDPNNAQVGIMARQLADQMAKERYLSTQENAFAILALGKLAKMANQTTATATILANNKATGTTTGAALSLNMKQHAGENLGIQVKGKGGYYYFWEVDGISADGSYKEEDSHLKVRRTYYDRQGHEMGNTFHQNDLVVVKISLETQNNSWVENVAITDMLPAGFEIENTRLSEMPKLDWIKDHSEPDCMDIRDDRINMFTNASNKRTDFYYMVRAVSPGTYQLGPVQADAMYDGNYHSYHGAGVIKILEK